jgi:hypothetical protein
MVLIAVPIEQLNPVDRDYGGYDSFNNLRATAFGEIRNDFDELHRAPSEKFTWWEAGSL